MKKFFVKKFLVLLILSFPIVLFPFTYAETKFSKIPDSITVSQILQNQKEWDGNEISYQGEVIGQAIFEKNHVWINVMDREFNAMGFWIPSSEIKKISNYGKFGVKGDILEMKGVFHKVCPQHGGETDIHSDLITVLEKGSLFPKNRIPISKMILCVLLLAGIVLLYFFTSFKKSKD